MKTPDKNLLIRFWAGDLNENEQQSIRRWIKENPEQSKKLQSLESEIQQTEAMLASYKPELQPPAGYWNEFMPRFWNQVEPQQHPIVHFKRWIPVIVPALAAATLLVVLLMPGQSNKELSEDWLYSFSSEDIIENLLNQEMISQDDLFAYSTSSDEAILEEESITVNIINDDALIFDVEESLQKLDAETRREVMRELTTVMQ